MSETGRVVLLSISIAYVICRFVHVVLEKKNFIQTLEIMALVFMGIFLFNV